MPCFGAQHDAIPVHVTSESSHDYRRAEVKLRIRYGASWPNERADLLLGVIYPVCGLAFAKEQHNARPSACPDFPSCTSNGSNPAGRMPRVVLQAAQADQGVAAGWHLLVRIWSKTASS